MDFKAFYFTTGRNILLLIGQILVVIICISYIEFIYANDIYPDKVVSETYVETQCVIGGEHITTHGKVIHRYRADFLINYAANGIPYSTWVSGNGLDHSFTSNRASQEDVLSNYQLGSAYPCWYNPRAPQMAVLVLRHSWSSTFPLFIPSVILLTVIYYLLRTLFQLMGFATIKTREALRERQEKKNLP